MYKIYHERWQDETLEVAYYTSHTAAVKLWLIIITSWYDIDTREMTNIGVSGKTRAQISIHQP
jgi:hypothetical protein